MLSTTSESLRTSHLIDSPAAPTVDSQCQLTPLPSDLDEEIMVTPFRDTPLPDDSLWEESGEGNQKTSPSGFYCSSPLHFLMEVLYVLRLQLPIMSTYGSDYLVIVVQMYFAGRLGAAALASVSLGASFCNVFGFSLGIGLLSAFDILAAQAYGAKELKRIGVALHQTFVAMIILAFVVLPLWWYSEPVLLLLGQDAEVASLSGLYIQVTWFGLLPSLIYSTLRRYMQNQGIVLPSTVAGATNILINLATIWFLADYMQLGFIALPMSRIVSSSCSAILMTLYIAIPRLHRPTWVPFSFKYLRGLGGWGKLAAPGAFMVCSEWWGMEAFAFLAGLFGAEALAAMALLYNIYSFFYAVPISFTVVATALAGNAVGAGDVKRAKFHSQLVMGLALITQATIFAFLYTTRAVWPTLFTDDELVLNYVSQSVLLFCLFAVFDTMQATLNGTLRGAGRLMVGASSYIVAYYLVGMGVGLPLAFVSDQGVHGLWIGLVAAAASALVVLSIYMLFLNWDKAVKEAKERLAEGKEMETMQECNLSDSSDSGTELEELEDFSSFDQGDDLSLAVP